VNLDPQFHVRKIERTAQRILDVRARYPDKTLAWLYDPQTMPEDLQDAHDANDAAVKRAYIAGELRNGRPRPKLDTDAQIVAFLFERYQALTEAQPCA